MIHLNELTQMTHSQIRPHYATQAKYLSSAIFYNVKYIFMA